MTFNILGLEIITSIFTMEILKISEIKPIKHEGGKTDQSQGGFGTGSIKLGNR